MTNIINEKLVVTPGLESDKTGLMVFWKLTGLLDQEEVDNAIGSVLPSGVLPSKVSASKNLSRALDVVKGNALLRPMGAQGFSLVSEDKEKLDLEAALQLGVKLDPYEVQLNVRVVKDANGVPTLKFTPDNHPQVQSIKEEYERQSLLYHAGLDVSSFLSTRVMPLLGAVSMRDRGGIYMVAGADNCAKLKKLRATLESVSQFDAIGRLLVGAKMYLTPVVFSEDLADVVRDSLTEEVDKMVSETMDRVNDDSLGVKAWRSQGRKVVEQQAKVEKFANILGVSLDHITKQLEELGAAILSMELKTSFFADNPEG